MPNTTVFFKNVVVPFGPDVHSILVILEQQSVARADAEFAADLSRHSNLTLACNLCSNNRHFPYP